MSNKETGGPAFPATSWTKDGEFIGENQGMTLRQYAAIKLKVPDSGTDWLDAMIEQSLRDDFAAKALVVCPMNHPADRARWCHQAAEAMLKAKKE